MKTNTKKEILELIKQKREITAQEIINNFSFTKAIIFRHLKDLINKEEIVKTGTPPRVFYYINDKIKDEKISFDFSTIDKEKNKIIKDNFLVITPVGELLEGEEAFVYWCTKQNLDIKKTINEYIDTFNKYNEYKRNDLISGIEKFKETFDNVFVDDIFYLDFYSIERFGKTKLGTLLLYAKQTQNKKLIEKIYKIINSPIKKLIEDFKIDAVGFIPATIDREIQFQKEIEKKLQINLPIIKLVKTKNEISIPQKSLSKLKDRIENTKKTIFVNDNNKYENILLIDDAVGSGATINETARKIKDKKLCKGKIYGLALTGSFKGFDIINEI